MSAAKGGFVGVESHATTGAESSRRWRQSVFAVALDRAVYVAYFLGAVVPLIALGVLIGRFSLDPVPEWRLDNHLPLLLSITILSLGCFLMLRRISRNALAEMRMDKETSARLLASSRSLVAARDPIDVCESGARTALTLTSADTAHVLLRDETTGETQQIAAAGSESRRVFQEVGDALVMLADLAIEQGSAVLRPDDCVTQHSANAISSLLVAQLRGERTQGAICVVHTEPGASFRQREVDSVGTLASLVSISLRNAEVSSSLQNFFSHATDAIVTLIDMNLAYNQGHARRVARLAHPVGRELNLDDDELRSLHFAALLHDIGTLAIPPARRHDRRTCLRHPVIGYQMLKGIRLWRGVAECVLHHHEWFDGSGYPSGISGEEIPIGSRIIAVCDAIDAMVSSTSYKAAVSDEEALSEIDKGSGTQFDPAVVRVVRALAREDRLISTADAGSRS